MTRILVIDNYDLLVYSVVPYLAQINADVTVQRNDGPRFTEPDWEDVLDGVLLSPGLDIPERVGVCVEVIRRLGEHEPLSRVYLEFRVMAVAPGGAVDRAGELLHGKVSSVTYDGKGVFTGLPSLLRTTRYHSLVVVEDKLPEELEITARIEPGVIMAVRYREWPMEAVQPHSESVLTKSGYQVLASWLVTCGDTDAPTRASGFGSLITADVDL